MTLLMLNIAPDVARALGSEDAILKVFHTAESGYRCAACGDAGRLTPAESASVLLVLRGPTGTPVVRLTHGCCADSGIVVSAEPLTANTGTDVPGKAWLRPHPDALRAMLLLGPRLAGMVVTKGGETVDQVTAGLLGHGFGLLTDPDAPLPGVDGLTVRLGPGGQLLVRDARDACVWDGALVLPPGWAEAARAAGRVGVVVAAGLNLYDFDRDHLADLFTAIGDGAVVAGAGWLLSDPQSDSDSGSHKRPVGFAVDPDPLPGAPRVFPRPERIGELPAFNPLTAQVNRPALLRLRKVTGLHDHYI